MNLLYRLSILCIYNFLQIYGLNDAEEIARLTSYICAGVIGLAVIATILMFVQVSDIVIDNNNELLCGYMCVFLIFWNSLTLAITWLKVVKFKV